MRQLQDAQDFAPQVQFGVVTNVTLLNDGSVPKLTRIEETFTVPEPSFLIGLLASGLVGAIAAFRRVGCHVRAST